MFNFFKSKPASTLPTHQPRLDDDDAWHVGGADGGYDDVSLGNDGRSRTGAVDGGAGGASDLSESAQSAAMVSRPSFSAPRATAGAFVGVTTSERSPYDTSTSTSNLTSQTASYPPPRSSSHRPPATNGYPSLRATFSRLEDILADSCPTLLDTLAAPLLPNAPALLSLLHAISPYYLPSAVLESYNLHDGQDPFASCQQGILYGLRWLPIDEVEQEWHFWRQFEQAGGGGGMHDAFTARTAEARRGGGSGRIHPYVLEDAEDGVAGVSMEGMSAFPPGWVRSRYSHPGWLPLLTDRVGNYIGVDLDPPPPGDGRGADGAAAATYGQAGQVIAFGREIDEKVVLFPGDSTGGWGRFLDAFVDDLARGEFGTLREGGHKAKNTSTWAGDAEAGAASSSDEDSFVDGDGLGDVDYLDGDRYGDEGEDAGLQLWSLRSEYHRWVANGGEGGIIGALAERSRRQWRNVGVGLAPAPRPPSGKPPLSVVVPPNDMNVEAGPESAQTERARSPNLMSTDSAGPSPEAQSIPPSSSSSSLTNGDESFTSDHPLNGALGDEDPSPTAVELTFSPPSPKTASRSGGLQAAANISPRSPDLLDDGRPGFRRGLGERRGASGSKQRRRPPPPAPMPFDLPTMDDLESPVLPNSDNGSVYGGQGGRISDSSLNRILGTPTRQTLLRPNQRSASTTVLVPGEDGLGLSGLALQDSGEVEVHVEGARGSSEGERLGGRSPPPPSDQPYQSVSPDERRGSAES